MRLSKPVYEKLPFIYFIVALYLFFNYDLTLTNVSAALLYVVSALVWVKRSDYRRQTRISKTVSGIRLPQIVYEYYPFVFLAASLAILKYFPQPIALAAALLMSLVALKNIIIRRQSRRANPLKFGAKQKLR
ncbi:hypothetical protein RGQ13_06630 [Thalassotalea psychrophila]|uniref:Uncharacterized protein n=1 Tax=Thalassotalea psychrophila TaxID=3065647 RepID=A0ABY9TZ55_9GAMM|nr:hypothetical protein RGQ13_06630 [Colwelliaceae bacterium SQ149]